MQDSYPEILNNMSPEDATLIMEYCNNHPIKYRRFISQLLGFGAMGYYLNDDKYVEYETLIVKGIKDWLNKKKPIFVVGDSIFKGLSGVSHRMSQDVLAEICCLFIDKSYSRWYVEMFEFLSKNIDLNKMSENSAKTLIEHITAIIKERKGHEQIKFAPLFLCRFRKQNRLLTEELDKAIEKHMPKYYDGDYRLETSESEQEDMPKFVQKYVDNVRTNNKTQGINGTYFGRGVRDIAVIRSILLNKDFKCSPDIMDSVISATADTLLMSKESLRTKLDAISLLVCIVLNYTDDYRRNALIFEKLYDQKEIIEAAENAPIFSNIDRISLNIGLQLLYTAMDKDTYSEILEVFPYLQNDIATTISVVNLMVEYLELNDSVRFPQNIEIVVLQNVLHWLHSDNLDIRWGATRIMFALIRNPENQSIINHQLITLIESQNVYIKNLILRNVLSMNGVTNSTKKYIVSKCENDANYVVRMVCGEMKEQLAK